MTMKSIKLLIASLCVTGIVSCGVASCGNDDDPEAPVWNGIKSPDDAKVTGTLSGDFDIDNPQPGSTATVTLSSFPGSLSSFRDLQSQVGGDPVGAAVLPLVGMEVYYQRADRRLAWNVSSLHAPNPPLPIGCSSACSICTRAQMPTISAHIR